MKERKHPRPITVLYTLIALVVCIIPALLIVPFYTQHKLCLLLINAATVTMCLFLQQSSKSTWVISEGLAVGVYLIAILLDVLSVQADVSVLVFISVHHVFLVVLTTFYHIVGNYGRK